ncbi:MAG: hypothetical protein NC114_06335 [Ruminococcus flavefaciens]|nr:hypothetical protein [Ruminococcus flavefaciens]
MNQLAEITTELFNEYVAPVAKSMMTGEVPSAMLTIHRLGTKDKDWLAQVQFKDGMPVSTFRCTVYLDDIFRLCRKCYLYLITEEIYRVVALYAMLHPLYQSQYNDFTKDLLLDYESMMAGAGSETYHFIKDYYPFADESDRIVLELLRYHMAIFTNHTKGEILNRKIKKRRAQYETYMLQNYADAYRTARFRKAQTCQVDQDGFIRLERLIEQEE